MSGIDILNIARDSLLSHQTAINLTGSNVANANTEGYSRQRAIFSTMDPGVRIAGIERMYDQFLGVQINEQTNSLEGNEARQDALSRIEMIFNESGGGGINELLSAFWNSWEDLSANPSGQAERMMVVSVSQSLASLFRSYGDDLLDVQYDANSRVSGLVDEINSYAEDMADINGKVTQLAGTGSSSGLNALKDGQESLLTSLAGIVDIHYTRNADDSVSIFLSNGLTLVDGNRSWELDTVADAQTSFNNVVFADDPATSINSAITEGSLAAYLEIRDTTVEGYLGSLDTLAASIATEVNTRHALGYDLDQNVGEEIFFFDVEPEVQEARYLKVSEAIIADANKIAASATVNGDGENAATMSALRDALTMNGGASTFNGYYSSFTGEIGQDVDFVNRSVQHDSLLMTQLTGKREELSGVSIDEEMMNLIKYQTGYNASARLFAAAQELSNTLMELVG